MTNRTMNNVEQSFSISSRTSTISIHKKSDDNEVIKYRPVDPASLACMMLKFSIKNNIAEFPEESEIIKDACL